MITPEFFVKALQSHGTDFFCGVPDSLLKDFCAYLTDNVSSDNHIIACNEGNAVGLCVGHHLATGAIPLVYMQNSGLGNTVNPLLSLADPDVYSIPIVLVIGWRGLPGVHDEPQHVKQGKVTLALLDAMRIPYVIMDSDENSLSTQIDYCYDTINKASSPFAFVVKKGTFAKYELKSKEASSATMGRESAIESVMLAFPDAIFVSTTGMISRELFEQRAAHGLGHDHDFLTVGGMGHASSIALSIALAKPGKKVVCLDGDGASLMHLGGYSTIGTKSPSNLVHIVLNNGAHDSVGGQPTVGFKVDLCKIAQGCGYPSTIRASTAEELQSALQKVQNSDTMSFVEVVVKKGARSNLGRPTTTALQNKISLMKTLA